MFLDDNGDLARSGATETVLRAHGPLDNEITLAVANNATYFSYASTGLGRGDVCLLYTSDAADEMSEV